LKKIYFTVTNDLTYDQRMQRICSSLAENGFDVILVGRKRKTSPPLKNEKFRQHRITCLFNKGKLFYVEYNFRLLFFLLFEKMDAICAIDLDTILPCLCISKWKRIPRVYDAHELFTELKEVITRPGVKKIWSRIEKFAVPKFSMGYTVSDGISAEFRRRYGVNYGTIRNVPRLRVLTNAVTTEKFILYQGAVNEGRGLEYLVPAMKMVEYKLVICGDGNFMVELQKLIRFNAVEKKIELKGMLLPDELWNISQQALIGVALAESIGLNQWLALPNKFFDYIHAGLPQVTMKYPEYEKINALYNVAVLLDELKPQTIATAINDLINDSERYEMMKENCLRARQELNWEREQLKLVAFYKSIFGE
jgi:glycosyltransferase involved in cell wall biosynthesis